MRRKLRGQVLTDKDEADLAAALETIQAQRLCIQKLRRQQRELFSRLANVCANDFPEIPALYSQDSLVKKLFEKLPSLYALRLFEEYSVDSVPLSMTPKSRHNVYKASFDGKVRFKFKSVFHA
jgi:hypothetical protein